MSDAPAPPPSPIVTWFVAGAVTVAAILIVGTMLYVRPKEGACAQWQSRYRNALDEWFDTTPSPDGTNLIIDAQPYENLKEMEPPPDGCTVPGDPRLRTGPAPTGPRIRD